MIKYRFRGKTIHDIHHIEGYGCICQNGKTYILQLDKFDKSDCVEIEPDSLLVMKIEE